MPAGRGMPRDSVQRLTMVAAGQIPPLPPESQAAADESYVEAAVRLCDGLERTVQSYAQSTDPHKQRSTSCGSTQRTRSRQRRNPDPPQVRLDSHRFSAGDQRICQQRSSSSQEHEHAPLSHANLLSDDTADVPRSAAAAAATLVVPGSALGLGGAVSANDRISVGMIGSGERANNTDHLLKLADAQIVAVCDPSQTKRESLRHRVEAAAAERRSQGDFSGCADYNDFRDLLPAPDIDAVFIASPENWHGLHALAAAQAKKDIYGEKAFTRTIAEGQAVVKAVRENKCVFQIGHQQRHDPIFRLAVEMVQQGEIGDLRRIKVGVPPNRTGPILSPQPLPEGFDYDLWLGPAPSNHISPNAC